METTTQTLEKTVCIFLLYRDAKFALRSEKMAVLLLCVCHLMLESVFAATIVCFCLCFEGSTTCKQPRDHLAPVYQLPIAVKYQIRQSYLRELVMRVSLLQTQNRQEEKSISSYLTSHLFCPKPRGSMGAFYRTGSVSGHDYFVQIRNGALQKKVFFIDDQNEDMPPHCSCQLKCHSVFAQTLF